MLNLRSYLYLNNQLLTDYLSAIDGFAYEEEVHSDRHNTSKEGEIKAGVPIVSGGGKISSSEGTEITKSVKITEAAKFQRIYDYLKSKDAIQYYESMSDEIWESLERDSFLEVLVNARFSKVRELVNAAKGFEQVAQVFGAFMETPLYDKNVSSAINGIKSLESMSNENEIPCVLTFTNMQEYPMVSYLDKEYLKVEKERFVGDFYMLCKVQRKIEKDQKVELDELFEKFKNLPLNREQRRKMPGNLNNPKEFRDVVKGPGAIVIPIAMYK